MSDAPDMQRLWIGAAIMVALLVVIGIVLTVVDRTLAPNDPRRAIVNKVLVYGGTIVFLIAMLWLRR
jgi:protein-S-isoprenylcysteine O-methyltransferase Ste14